MRLIAFVLLAMLWVIDGAQAAELPPTLCHGAPSPQAPRFIVSAILRKDSQDISIKLVHAVETATNADAALGIFTRRVLDDYPGYSLLNTLVSRLAPNCSEILA